MKPINKKTCISNKNQNEKLLLRNQLLKLKFLKII